MIGICIPAHNEEKAIATCLRAVTRAARHPGLRAEPVNIVVVLDHCCDRTATVSAAWPVHCLSIQARNVGVARAMGAQHLLDAGARWLAFTDADTRVSAGWLVDQLSLQAEVVCGTVAVSGWAAHGVHAASARNRFAQHYQDRDGHRHVHGANLGIEANAYRRIGGFAALSCSEDQALVDKLEEGGARIAWTSLPRVTTSARPYSRVEGGFASALREGWNLPGKPAEAAAHRGTSAVLLTPLVRTAGRTAAMNIGAPKGRVRAWSAPAIRHTTCCANG